MDLDHERGRAFIHQGITYYSPNCGNRSFPPVAKSSPSFLFKPTFDKYADYLQPRWLSTAFGYLAFIPTEPLYIGPLFSCLKDSRVSVVRLPDGKFGLEPSVKAEWMHLESGLIIVTDFLKNRHDADCLIARPPAPSMLDFRKSYTNIRWAREQVIRSRDWFLVWIGVSAFLIAQAEDNIETYDEIPLWYTQFVQTHPSFPQSWLDDFRSLIHHYLLNFPTSRVGGLVDPFESGNRIPRLSWMHKWNVPFWYPWGPAQERIVGIESTLWYLRPPSAKIKAATPYIPRTPSPETNSPHVQYSPPPSYSPYHEDDNDAGREFRERQRRKDLYIRSKPWNDFFVAREEAFAAYLATETPQQKTTRENRARIPPTVSAEVFEWDWSEEDRCKLVRTRVPKKQRGRALHSAFNRCEYDARLNVWEVSRYFDFGAWGSGEGEDNDDEDDSGDDGLATLNPLLSPTHHPDQPDPENEMSEEMIETELKLRSGQALAEGERAVLELDLLEDIDVAEYLSSLYGFLWPVPWPNQDAEPLTWSRTLKNVGLRSTTPVHPSIPAIIVDFIEGLCSKSKQSPPCALFDLKPGSRLPMPIEDLRGKIRKSGEFFIVQQNAYKSEEPCEWNIALTSASDAVRAFRLLQGGVSSPVCLSLRLVDLGITFRTLHPLQTRPTSSLSSPSSMIPIRLHQHVFTADDYSAYVRRRTAVLSSPRARSALLAGGLIWRLALEHLGKEAVASGPTTAVVQHGLGFVFEAQNGDLYGDDELTQEEISVVCGLYKCDAEKKNQTKLLSWWPLPNKWYNHASNAYHWGHWTDLDEEWFQNRSKQLAQGAAQPLPPAQWRTQLKGITSWRTTVDRHSKAAEELYS